MAYSRSRAARGGRSVARRAVSRKSTARGGYRRSSGASRGARASQRGSSRGTVVRVVIQQAPTVPAVSQGAVSMDALKKARF